MKQEILRLERVTRIIDGVTQLDNMNLHIFQGEIMGLVCINAHGKEALVRLICQNLPIHYGYIYFQEQLVNNYEHSSMGMNRVSVIEQRSRLVEDLTVADNIFVLRRGFKKYLIEPRVLERQLRQFTDEFGVEIDAGAPVSQLSFFERCVVELLRAVVTGVKLVVIRDISNFISAADLVKIHRLLHRCAARGMSFLYICSHHEEAFTICDRITLMEDGRALKVLDRPNFRDETVLSYARGYHCADGAGASGSPPRDGAISFSGVRTEQMRGMSFSAGRGECVVLLDMNNTVLSDLVRLLSRGAQPQAGEILVGGESWAKNARRLKKQLAFIGEDPIHTSLFREMSYLDNLCFWLGRREPALWLNPAIQKSIVREYAPLVGEDIHAPDITGLSPASLYSLVYCRAHLLHPRVLFCAQPFSGADLYLRSHIIDLIGQVKARGTAVVLLAVSISDCLSVADRLLVVEQGQLRREYLSDEFPLFRAGK
ncbi:ATP-binding cassette domain-containing protein [uncultured Anaerotruncus sp.]|uniref:ATP-binding cassette domain-containing protein n=1 Tax=uncultured Anaerotruncus sp. TaxID=905011 RepID=UPI00280C2C5A|nr:ATP-binding cassette domain-containing protein [uncultured Anaerotruncus sp.]